MRRLILWPTLLVLVFVAACAGNLRPKQITVNMIQSISGALTIAQDTSRALCFPGAQAGQPIATCTDGAAKIGLTTDRFRSISGALAQAFELNVKLATAAKAWQPDQPAPTELAGITALLKQALAVVQQLVPSAGATALIETINRVMAAVESFLAEIKSEQLALLEVTR